MFSQPKLSTKAKELQLTNSFVTSHDFVCNCKEPAKHCLNILIKQLAPELTDKEKLQIQQCLGTTTAAATTAGEDDLGLEDLEKLFELDDTSEEATG